MEKMFEHVSSSTEATIFRKRFHPGGRTLVGPSTFHGGIPQSLSTGVRLAGGNPLPLHGEEALEERCFGVYLMNREASFQAKFRYPSIFAREKRLLNNNSTNLVV